MRKNFPYLLSTFILLALGIIAYLTYDYQPVKDNQGPAWVKGSTDEVSHRVIEAGKPLWHALPRLLLYGR
jgi:hypothetical protein